MLHTGIDLHKRDLVVATVDSAGPVVQRGRLRTAWPAVAAHVRALGREQRAVVESTATWHWLADLLRAGGVALGLGHSRYIKAIGDARRSPCDTGQPARVKTAAVDAATLAQLLRSDLVPEAHEEHEWAAWHASQRSAERIQSNRCSESQPSNAPASSRGAPRALRQASTAREPLPSCAVGFNAALDG